MRACETTETQRQRLASILQKHGANAPTHTDQAMQALLTETKKMASLLKGDDLRDAGLIASVRKLEHMRSQPMALLLCSPAKLNLRDDQRTLHESLEEEGKTDALLTKLAKGEVNQDALAA